MINGQTLKKELPSISSPSFLSRALFSPALSILSSSRLFKDRQRQVAENKNGKGRMDGFIAVSFAERLTNFGFP